jgi:succinate dehydrogenase/fumarate reductase flavoprotein subunit
MELDVTHMVEDADDMVALSGSVMEHGQDAGRITWNYSVQYAREHPLLKTDAARDAARAHFREYGAWSADEIAAWSEEELQGLMCQDVAYAVREMDVAEDYEEYQKLSEQGTVSGRLWRGDDGRWYFDLGM